ncbi:uncharacterized protein J4E87_003397 [Alternaria ethzedia]|uniref:uncharacterized protein n=1 Tax=Alternaria ethzedia TaxID=181014 RepID=UPI0020C22BDB|nr:uncharacterized protein J4E87_003397 [Alternaria ethzedia]KAI4629136.1 hypothetical protein J4E87_003397 [Alternaria ethzedia]
MPSMPEDIGMDIKPYFRVLQQDGPIANATSERLQLSENLEEALHTLQDQNADIMDEWYFDEDLDHPYPKLDQFKHVFVGPRAQTLESQQREDLKVLSDYITERLTLDYGELEQLSDAGLVSRKHWLMLFRPDDTVVTMFESQYRAFSVKSCLLLSSNTIEMECWSWEYDGNFFQKHTTMDIEWPSSLDQVKIKDLSVQANLRYMVDAEAYKLMHGRDDDPTSKSGLSSEELKKDEPPGGAFTLMLPATMKGYGFHNKKWNTLLVEHIQDIKWNSGVFDKRLVLEEGKKDLVKALVTVHIEKSSDIKTDFMDGKGEGLIMLLHGGPGTGKTLTAESIAELVHRPLYRVTCGDIGTDAESVEKYLESALFIGNTWDCVVLLDEADVFLEERTKMDLQRNALVSVFLRVLEYYDGILILTTNRIGTFDEAFKSRIQLALHYPPLNRDGRWEVWRNFVKSLSEAGESINTEEITNKLDILARHKLNGRQIRNTINTARQLARYKKDSLRYAHVDQAVRVVNEFEKYVTDVHGHDDEEYARDQGLRNDDALQVD